MMISAFLAVALTAQAPAREWGALLHRPAATRPRPEPVFPDPGDTPGPLRASLEPQEPRGNVATPTPVLWGLRDARGTEWTHKDREYLVRYVAWVNSRAGG